MMTMNNVQLYNIHSHVFMNKSQINRRGKTMQRKTSYPYCLNSQDDCQWHMYNIRHYESVCIITVIIYCQLRWHPFLSSTLNNHIQYYLSYHVLCVLFFTRFVSSPNTSNILDHVNMHTCENPTNWIVSIQHFKLYKSYPHKQ